MNNRIIVIGASAGGLQAIKKLIARLPADFEPSIFIVWHMASDLIGILPEVLNRQGTIAAENARDGTEILPNRIYVAPPDHHMLIDDGKIRITKGPKENRFRPAIDPLFRSAAQAHGAAVIGVILSGFLSDGTSGLWTIKKYGGICVVQDPADAEVPDMPRNALREVSIDHVVAMDKMPGLLLELSTSPISQQEIIDMNETEKTKIEIDIALEKTALTARVLDLGTLTPYTCPECHGVLLAIKEGEATRYRCHTGHAFSADSLLATLTENIEATLWSAIRGVEESMLLLRHLGDHFSKANEATLASVYYQKAKEAEQRIEQVRKATFAHEQLSVGRIAEQSRKKDA